ncbi:MAG: aspartate aminotransferase [Chitinophagales bacterium]|jgi:aspartate aminotransferase
MVLPKLRGHFAFMHNVIIFSNEVNFDSLIFAQNKYPMNLSDLLKRVPASATIVMAQKARDLKAQGKDIISLTLGEPDFDTPEHIKEAAIEAIKKGETKYTPVPGTLALRKAISEKFKRDNNLAYSIDQIVVSCGAKQTIANIALSVINEGDEILLPAPYWVSYAGIADMCNGKKIIVKTNIDNDFKVTPSELEAAITDKTRLLIFSSPCNPTGSRYSKSELEALAEVIAKYPRLIVLSDEIYEYINFTEEKHFSIGEIPSLVEQVVTVNGVSKGFAMTGWRIGYMGAPLWLAKACAKLQGQFTSGACSISQAASAHALSSSLAPTMAMRDSFKERRDIMLNLLGEIEGMKLNVPEGAFYIFPDVSAYFGKSFENYTIDKPTDLVMYLLETVFVATVGGEPFGDDNCMRISYAASEESLREAVRRMKVALAKLK